MKGQYRRFLVCLAAIALLAVGMHAQTACAAFGDCGQPLSEGDDPTSLDCLFILRASVGSESCDPECICNTGGTGGISASDALICLRRAVGVDVALHCPCADCGLFVNGTFEDPVNPGASEGWTFGNTDGAGGWKATGGNPGGHFTLNQSGQLATDPTLAQTVDGLQIGRPYRITGEYRSFAAGFGNAAKPDAFAVIVEPQPEDHDSTVILELPRPAPTPTAWTEFSVDFVPAEATATVSFVAERDGDDSSFDLDNLCLTVIP